LRRIKEGG